MKTDPVTLLWHILRDDETQVRPVDFEFSWPQGKWNSTTGTTAQLATLYKALGSPHETRITTRVPTQDRHPSLKTTGTMSHRHTRTQESNAQATVTGSPAAGPTTLS